MVGFCKRTIAEILMNLDGQHLSKAEQWFLQAIETDKCNGMLFELGMDHAAYATWFKRKAIAQKRRKT